MQRKNKVIQIFVSEGVLSALSQWNQMDSSDTASGCDEQRNNMVRMYSSGDMTSVATQFKLWLYHNSVCVSSADPRLNQLGKQLTRQPLK